MVLGEYEQKFNGKNRIALAKKMAKEFGKKIILSKGFDTTCIFGFSEKVWEEFARQEFEKPMLSKEGLSARRKMFAGAEEVEIDFQNRIVVPKELLDFAAIESSNSAEMMVVGAGDHLEIWNKEKWIEYLKTI